MAFMSDDLHFFKDVQVTLWGISNFLTLFWVKLNLRPEVNSQPTHFLTLMNNGKVFSSLDGVAYS